MYLHGWVGISDKKSSLVRRLAVGGGGVRVSVTAIQSLFDTLVQLSGGILFTILPTCIGYQAVGSLEQ